MFHVNTVTQHVITCRVCVGDTHTSRNIIYVIVKCNTKYTAQRYVQLIPMIKFSFCL